MKKANLLSIVFLFLSSIVLIYVSIGDMPLQKKHEGNSFDEGGCIEITYWKDGKAIGHLTSLRRAVLRYMDNADSVTIEQKQ